MTDHKQACLFITAGLLTFSLGLFAETRVMDRLAGDARGVSVSSDHHKSDAVLKKSKKDYEDWETKIEDLQARLKRAGGDAEASTKAEISQMQAELKKWEALNSMSDKNSAFNESEVEDKLEETKERLNAQYEKIDKKYPADSDEYSARLERKLDEFKKRMDKLDARSEKLESEKEAIAQRKNTLKEKMSDAEDFLKDLKDKSVEQSKEMGSELSEWFEDLDDQDWDWND